MIDAWLVVREEKHIDPRYWVCLSKADALAIAEDVAKYWRTEYAAWDDDQIITNGACEDGSWGVWYEDAFHVWIEPVEVREQGEVAE